MYNKLVKVYFRLFYCSRWRPLAAAAGVGYLLLLLGGGCGGMGGANKVLALMPVPVPAPMPFLTTASSYQDHAYMLSHHRSIQLLDRLAARAPSSNPFEQNNGRRPETAAHLLLEINDSRALATARARAGAAPGARDWRDG